jgi:hypothetical protein
MLPMTHKETVVVFKAAKELEELKFFILKQARIIIKERVIHAGSYQYRSSNAAPDRRIDQ